MEIYSEDGRMKVVIKKTKLCVRATVSTPKRNQSKLFRSKFGGNWHFAESWAKEQIRIYDDFKSRRGEFANEPSSDVEQGDAMTDPKERGLLELAKFLGEQIKRLNDLKRVSVVMNGFEDGIHEEEGNDGEYVRVVDLDKIVETLKKGISNDNTN